MSRANDPKSIDGRRGFIGRASLLAGWTLGSLASATLTPAWAQRLLVTPRQARGPFYPPAPPAEQDADLVRVGGGAQLAQGEITHLSGQVFDAAGKPTPGVRVEIWQCNAHGRYHHPDDRSAAPIDPNFQGFGAALTDAAGNYAFRTIKPVPYPGRAPHIHFRLASAGRAEFVTQMYIAGHPGNSADGLLMGVRDPRARDALLVPFRPLKGDGGRTEWSASFDIVMPS
jgi:protocatechuate 3,4-dioxygenase beta subunit